MEQDFGYIENDPGFIEGWWDIEGCGGIAMNLDPWGDQL